MRIVKFNDIKDQFQRMSILWSTSKDGLAKHYTKRNGEFYSIIYSSKVEADAVMSQLSELNPEGTLFGTGEEYAKAQTEIRYPGKKMYGFANEGIVDYVDSEKSVTFYFN